MCVSFSLSPSPLSTLESHFLSLSRSLSLYPGLALFPSPVYVSLTLCLSPSLPLSLCVSLSLSLSLALSPRLPFSVCLSTSPGPAGGGPGLPERDPRRPQALPAPQQTAAVLQGVHHEVRGAPIDLRCNLTGLGPNLRKPSRTTNAAFPLRAINPKEMLGYTTNPPPWSSLPVFSFCTRNDY